MLTNGLRSFGTNAPLSLKIATFVGAVILSSGSVSIGAILWAADQKLDEKYATDEDVETLRQEVESNGKAIEQNGESLNDVMTLVLESEISRIGGQIRELESKPMMTEAEEQYLAELVRRLAELQRQRNALRD